MRRRGFKLEEKRRAIPDTQHGMGKRARKLHAFPAHGKARGQKPLDGMRIKRRFRIERTNAHLAHDILIDRIGGARMGGNHRHGERVEKAQGEAQS
jgi:hypothetical protein